MRFFANLICAAFNLWLLFFGKTLMVKLNGVGPVDNRPSTNKLHNIVQKKYIL